MFDDLPPRNRRKYSSVLHFTDESKNDGDLQNPILSANDLKWKADQTRKSAEQYSDTYLPDASRMMKETQAQKQAFSNWEATWNKAKEAGIDALTEQEKRFFETFNRLHPTDDSKQTLFSSLYETLDRKIADSQKVFDQATKLNQDAQNAAATYHKAQQSADGAVSASGGGALGNETQKTNRAVTSQTNPPENTMPAAASAGKDVMPNPGMSLPEARRYLIENGMDSDVVMSLLPEIAVEDKDRRVIRFPNASGTTISSPDYRPEPLVKTFNDFQSILDGLTAAEARAYFLLCGASPDWVANIWSERDVMQYQEKEKELWEKDNGTKGFSVPDLTIIDWIEKQYSKAEDSGDTWYMRRLAHLFDEFYGEAKERRDDGYSNYFSQANDGVYSYRDWSEQGLPPAMPGFTIEYITRDRVFKHGGEGTTEQKAGWGLLTAATSQLLGDLDNVATALSLAGNLAYVGAVKQYMEYNPGFILQEGDLMVYDGRGAVTSYYRGDEFLYSVDVDGHEVFSPDYIRHIPGLDERKAKAIENMIFDIVLPNHASR